MAKRFLSLALTLLLVAAFPLLSGCQQSKELIIFTWADYITPEVVAAFEAETGVKVTLSDFASNEECLMKLQATQGRDYDLVLVGDYVIDMARREGLVKELDKAKIPRYGDIRPEMTSKYYDPENTYTVPYVAGSPLIVYDPAVVPFEITGYKDLWNPELRDSITIMDDMRMVTGVALWSLGYSLNATDPAQLEEAKQALFELKPNIRVMDYDRPQDRVVSGEASVGFMFTSQVVQAMEAKPDLKLVFPEERLGYGLDAWFIPLNAPNPDNAHAFLNFILDGERAAALSEKELYLSCVSTSDPYLSDWYKTRPALNIPPEMLADAEMMQDVGDATPLYEQIWVEFGNYTPPAS